MYQSTQKIRYLINNPRKQYNLLKNLKFWNQMCSSLDVIGDSDLAIDAYEKGNFPQDHGERYLWVYGLLQALFIQQDAVAHLCESLSIPIKKNATLDSIRDVRNKSIGHPTKKDRPKPVTYHFISRFTISKSGFQLMSCLENGKSKFQDISIDEMIVQQRGILTAILKFVIKKLHVEELAHKKRFKMDKLIDVFSHMDFSVQEIFKGLKGGDKSSIGGIGIKMAKGILKDFKKKLNERGLSIDTYDSIKYLYGYFIYPLSELDIYFKRLQNGDKVNINAETAYIFYFFIKEHFNELKQIAQGIDDEYSK